MSNKIKHSLTSTYLVVLVIAAIWGWQSRSVDSVLQAQQAPVQAISQPGPLSLTAVGVSSAVNLTGTGVKYHTLTSYAPTTVTAYSVQIEGSLTSSFAVTTLLGSALSGGSPGGVPISLTTAAYSQVNYVRFRVLSMTGSGTISGVYRGYVQDPSAQFTANGSATVTSSSAGMTSIVTANTNGTSVMGWGLTVGSSVGTGAAWDWVYGSGTTCLTGTTALTGVFASASSLNANSIIGNGTGTLFNVPAGKALCLRSYNANVIGGFVTYKQEN